MSRRGATSLVGILPVDKPGGMTSHDVVARVRRATGEGRVGHAGTLDPMATGVLVVLIGAYTRLAPYLTSATKSYDATISFGSETDTDDAEGTPVRDAPVPPEVFDEAYAREAVRALLGPQLQMPPAYSAIKMAGTTAHSAARSGSPLDLEPRAIDVVCAELVGLDRAAGTWDVSFTVSKGTYIRALARDLGRSCGSAAHLSALRRTSSGVLTLEDTHSLDEVDSAAADGHLHGLFADPLHALALPVVECGGSAVLYGAAFPLPADPTFTEGDFAAVTHEGRLAAVYRAASGRLEPAAVLVVGGGQ